jgi:hypothetical protein
MNDGWYFFNDGEIGPNGSTWLSIDNWPAATPLSHFMYTDGTVHYFDYDMKAPLTSANYNKNADLKMEFIDISGKMTWHFSIGTNGTWRGKYNATELWTIERDFSGEDRAFVGVDNDSDNAITGADDVEVFITARASGITVAPGANYTSDKSDVLLINDANKHLPNPMPQLLEAGFYVSVEQ